MGGERITFRHLEVECNSEPNAQLFINGSNGAVPTDVVCDSCFLGDGAATTLLLGHSVASGARNTKICPVLLHRAALPGDGRCREQQEHGIGRNQPALRERLTGPAKLG